MPKPKYDMIEDSEEFGKMKASRGAEYDDVPREQPSGQAPGGAGYDKPNYADWTTAELQEAARKLEISNWNNATRKELVQRLRAARQA